VELAEAVRAALLASFLVLGVSACGGTKTVTVTQTVTVTKTVTAPPATVPACAADHLSGTFDLVDGSAGAGSISYRLRLQNDGTSPCSLTGLPDVQLVDARGVDLPTNVQPSLRPPAAATIALAPGKAAVAEARFSPDVPGAGEGSAPCEAKAEILRVTSGGAFVELPVRPPTPVCEHGTLSFDNYSAAT
jgi:hypothetical protein